MTSNTYPLFGTDGIRGIAGQEPLTKEFISKIISVATYVFKTFYKTRKVVIGHDTRESSKWITQVVCQNFLSAGYQVYLVNVFTTAGVAFLCRTDKSLGVVISASHNPYQYNGIKFLSPLGTKIPSVVETKIEHLIKQNKKFKKNHSRKVLTPIIYESTAEDKYVNFLKNIFKNDLGDKTFRKPSLVVDCGNGAAYNIAKKVFSSFFEQVTYINVKPDGKNINKNCGALYPETVKEYLNNGQIGVTFDGDTDRVIFVDEEKNVRDGDYIIGVLATEYKRCKKLKNSLVVVSVMANFGLIKYLEKIGVKTILCPVGDKYVSEYLKKYKGNLGGEQAGHIVLYDYLPTGDGIITALEVLKTVIKNNVPLYKLCQIFTKYPQVLKNVKTEIKPPIEKIFEKEDIKSLEKKICGRIVLRYSGTEPLFRIMVEGEDKNKIQDVASKIETRFLDYINKISPKVKNLCQS